MDKKRAKITIEFVLVRNSGYAQSDRSEAENMTMVQQMLNDGWLEDVTNDAGKLVKIEFIDDHDGLPN